VLRTLALFCVCLGTLLAGVSASAQDFVLREALQRYWSQVVGSDGNAVASQLTDAAGKPRLAFQVTLAPGATQGGRAANQMRAAARLPFEKLVEKTSFCGSTTQSYRLGKAEKPATSDLKVEETADRLVLSNAHIGLALRKRLQGDEAPIAGVRLRSGVWTAGSKRTGGAEVASYRVQTLAKGPVFAEALCQVEFADQGTWSLRFRVLRDEPVVLVSETMDAPAGGHLLVPLGGNAFQPSQLLYRRGKGDIGLLDTWRISPRLAYTLEPWLRWWVNERQGNWFAVYSPGAAPSSGGAGDMLMAAALRPSQW
jgi:hypothetical protein